MQKIINQLLTGMTDKEQQAILMAEIERRGIYINCDQCGNALQNGETFGGHIAKSEKEIVAVQILCTKCLTKNMVANGAQEAIAKNELYIMLNELYADISVDNVIDTTEKTAYFMAVSRIFSTKLGQGMGVFFNVVSEFEIEIDDDDNDLAYKLFYHESKKIDAYLVRFYERVKQANDKR